MSLFWYSFHVQVDVTSHDDGPDTVLVTELLDPTCDCREMMKSVSVMSNLTDQAEMPCQHIAALLIWAIYGCMLRFDGFASINIGFCMTANMLGREAWS